MRRQGTEAGSAGRFLDADAVQAGGGDPRTGQQTPLGEALDIPTARSRHSALPLTGLCMFLLAVNTACAWIRQLCLHTGRFA